MSISETEKKFYTFWKEERKKGARAYRIYMVGIRNGLIFSCAVLLSFITGWYKRIPLFTMGDWTCVLIALFILVVFMSIFTAAYQRDQNEQEYEKISYKLQQAEKEKHKKQ